MINYTAILLNLGVAGLGSIIGLILMLLGYFMFDRITPFDTSKQLNNGNTAVGIVIGSICIGISIIVSLITGLTLN